MRSDANDATDNHDKRRFNRSSWSTLVRYAWFMCAVLAAIVLLAALPSYYKHYVQAIRADSYGLSGFNLPLKVLIELSDLTGSLISFALAVLLFWRKPNDHMALFASFFLLITAVASSYSLDYFLTAYFGAPSTYDLLSDLQTPLWILIFSIFPDGRFVPRWTRWLFIVSVLAWFPTLAGAEWRFIANVITYPLFFLLMYAQVHRYRWVSNHAERKQTKWWLYGVCVSMLLSLAATIIYKKISPPLLNVTPIFLTIAIVRSHLWDIDIIIRRTLIYSVLTAILAMFYLGIVIALQQILRPIIAQESDLAIIVSTLAIAALFNPLRHRVQDVIDKRFYRRKYDAQQVIARFSATVRDEVELEKLTGELLNVVSEAMQPTHSSLWLRKTDGGQK